MFVTRPLVEFAIGCVAEATALVVFVTTCDTVGPTTGTAAVVFTTVCTTGVVTADVVFVAALTVWSIVEVTPPRRPPESSARASEVPTPRKNDIASQANAKPMPMRSQEPQRGRRCAVSTFTSQDE